MLTRLLFVAVLSLVIVSVKVNAQSAVYFCKNTGYYGFCYGESSDMKARECAYTNCIRIGGSQPTMVAYTGSKGFGAICIGEDYLGNTIIGVALAKSTQDEADAVATKLVQDQGGYKMRIRERWEDK